MSLFAKHDLSCSIVEAIYGPQLCNAEVAKIYERDRAIKYLGRELTCGELGCALSHKSIYRLMVDENVSEAVVLEDDIAFGKEFVEFLQARVYVPDNCDVVLLGHHSWRSRMIPANYSCWYKRKISASLVLRRPCELACGTYGYYIRKSGAEKLLEHMGKIYMPVDHYTGSDRLINLYILESPIIYIHEALSKFSNIEKVRNEWDADIAPKHLSLKGRIAKYLGVYDFLSSVANKKRYIAGRIKPLRRYQ